MSGRVAGKLALVTGAAQGLGAAQPFGGDGMGFRLFHLDKDHILRAFKDQIDFARKAAPAAGGHRIALCLIVARHRLFGGKAGMPGPQAAIRPGAGGRRKGNSIKRHRQILSPAPDRGRSDRPCGAAHREFG